MSYVKKLAAQSGDTVYLLQSKTKIGTDCYHYVLVKSGKTAQFEQIGAGAEVNIREYGTIIHKGYGEPSDKVKKMILDKYGSNN
jgi:hypothetical protein